MMRKKRLRRPDSTVTLSITSLMDMMTIILVFLLTLYGTNVLPVQPSEDFQLPHSTAERPPRLLVTVIVTVDTVFVDGEALLTLGASDEPDVPTAIPAAEKDGQVVKAVYDRLIERVAAIKREGGEEAFEGEVLLQLDRRTPFAVVRDLMFTAGHAGYGAFRFVVVSASGP